MVSGSRPFRVAFVTGVTVSKWTTVWAQRHPHVALQLIHTDAASQETALTTGVADMSFVRLPVDAALSVIPLYSEAAFVVVARDHPIALFDTVTVGDLADEQLLTEAPDDAIALVAAGAGVAIMPQSIARLHNRKDVVARPVVDAAQTTIGLAWIADTADQAEKAASAGEIVERIDEFIGIVRGRTARSSRGSVPDTGETPARTTPKQQSSRPSRSKRAPRGPQRRRTR